MITFANAHERKVAIALWKQHATSYEVNTQEYRFVQDWLNSDIVAHMDDQSMSAFIMEKKLSLRMGIHTIGVFFIPWSIYDNEALQTKLLKERLSIHAHQALGTIIVSENEVLMRSLKAHPWIVSQSVNLSKSMIEPKAFSMVTFELPVQGLLDAYNLFMKRFESTIVRTPEDFNFNQSLASSRRKRAGIIENDRVLGYMDYELTPYGVDIREIIYEDIDTLLRLLSFSASLHHHITIFTSQAERFEKLFPQANISKKVESWLVLHHPSLWSDLFKQTITDASDCARVLSHPLMMHTR
jgi:hypothetical protein